MPTRRPGGDRLLRALRGGAESAADLGALLRTGALRPLRPRAALEVARRLATEGFRADLVFTIHAAQEPERVALVHEGRSITWGPLYERVLRLANWLQEAGVRPGDAVGVMLPNRPEFLEAQAAAMRIGAVAALMNPRAPADAARALVERVGPRVLVTHRHDTGTARVLMVGDDYEAAIASAPAREPRVPRRAHGRMVIFTSGTTGRPKGAVRSLDRSASASMLGLLRVVPFRRDDVYLTVCPLYHASGAGFTTLAMALGNPVVLVEKFTPEAFCRAVQRYRVTSTTVVPTMLHELVAFEPARRFDLRSLRVVVCTGSPLREDARGAARALVGDVVYDLYGATEMGWVSVATPDDQRRRPGTVGRPVPGVDVRILGPDGTVVPRGEPGEIWAGNPFAMDGYLGDPDLTRERMRDGYVSVGDVGVHDADGFLHVVDRVDDMIITGGVNVYPAETEAALESHPGVREAAVLGVPDAKWGQRVVAAVVSDDARIVEPQLIRHCKGRVPPAAVPKEIRFVDRLPRNDVGKVLRRQIAGDWGPAPGPNDLSR